MRAFVGLALVFGVYFAACGGSQQPPVEEPATPVETDPSEPVGDDGMDADASVDEPWPDGAGMDASADGAMPDAPVPAVTFEIVNEGKNDLVFAIDKGWQPVLFAYSGKPPKAKSIIMFAKGCTASCEAPTAAEMCPKCEFAEDLKTRKQQETDETQRAIVAPGTSLAVPWDGVTYVYKKPPKATRKEAKHMACECWTATEAPAAEYTVKACGLRPSNEAGKPTTSQCAEATATFPPVANEPMTVRIVFPAPPPAKK